MWLLRGGRVLHLELGAETRCCAAAIPPEDPHRLGLPPAHGAAGAVGFVPCKFRVHQEAVFTTTARTWCCHGGHGQERPRVRTPLAPGAGGSSTGSFSSWSRGLGQLLPMRLRLGKTQRLRHFCAVHEKTHVLVFFRERKLLSRAESCISNAAIHGLVLWVSSVSMCHSVIALETVHPSHVF